MNKLRSTHSTNQVSLDIFIEYLYSSLIALAKLETLPCSRQTVDRQTDRQNEKHSLLSYMHAEGKKTTASAPAPQSIIYIYIYIYIYMTHFISNQLIKLQQVCNYSKTSLIRTSKIRATLLFGQVNHRKLQLKQWANANNL